MLQFYFLGDMGSGERSQYLVSNALTKHIGSKDTFVCGLGDNIYETGCTSINDEQFITKFEKPYGDIPDKIKFYMCIGNHDYGTDWGKGNSITQIKYGKMSEKQGKKWVMPRNYYSFRKKDKNVTIDFFVIDTNLYNLTREEIKKQSKIMSRAINDSNADWKIVNGHHTWRSIAGHGNADKELELFLKGLYDKSPFDLYVCGHDHNKQLINMEIEDSILPLIVCGTGGKVYHDYINFNRLDDKCELEFYSNNLGYAFIRAFKTKLELTFLNEKNIEEFNYEIKKSRL
jgi:tartrate-resistant acid phosphatase type 5